ncbi:MAG: tetratricopeptide repeat protein [Nitrospira sp.]|nr:tetratricopeptide repeat protein [Nitrospira sp.]
MKCEGVNPKVVDRLIELLDQRDNELGQARQSLDAKIKEANDWISRYNDLEARLAGLSETSELAKQAKALLDRGELQQAGQLYDQVLEGQEKEMRTLAENHFSRGQIHGLEFHPDKALLHYEKATRYAPENLTYLFAYAAKLHKQNDFSKAERAYSDLLSAQRALVQTNPAAYEPHLGTTLDNLATLYADTQRFTEAEKAFQDALTLRRRLAQANPAAYEPDVAITLNNLATLYADTQRFTEAEEALQEVKTIRQRLAQKK